MLCWLSSHDNGLSMVIYPSCMKHGPSVVIVSCQWTEHGFLFLKYETGSVSCHRLMVIHPIGMQHAPSLVIVP